MSSVTMHCTLALSCLGIFSLLYPASSQPTNEWLPDRLAATVSITSGCRNFCVGDNNDTLGTGFVFEHPQYGMIIVTAYHVVAGADIVELRFQDLPDHESEITIPSAVVSVRPAADLALVKLPPEVAPYIEPIPRVVAPFDRPDRGFSLGEYMSLGATITTPTSMTLSGLETFGTFLSRLPGGSELLSDGTAGILDPDTKTIGITSGIASGSSGGPVVSETGYLIGIAHGGFFDRERGDKISWAIDASELEGEFTAISSVDDFYHRKLFRKMGYGAYGFNSDDIYRRLTKYRSLPCFHATRQESPVKCLWRESSRILYA